MAMTTAFESPGANTAALKSALYSHGMREPLTADRTYYVRKDGNDSNTGRVNNAGGAFLTIQHGIDVLMSTIAAVNVNVNLEVTGGPYDENPILGPCVGGGNGTSANGLGLFNLRGNAAIISPSTPAPKIASIAIFNSAWGMDGNWTITPFPGDGGFYLSRAYVDLLFSGSMTFGNVGTAFDVEDQSVVDFTGPPIVFNGTVDQLGYVAFGSFLGLGAITFEIDPGLTSGIVNILRNSQFVYSDNAWTGSAATPGQSNVSLGSSVVDNGSFLPASKYDVDSTSLYNGALGVAQKAGAVIAADIPIGTSKVIHDTSGGTYRLYANIGGVLKSIALS